MKRSSPQSLAVLLLAGMFGGVAIAPAAGGLLLAGDNLHASWSSRLQPTVDCTAPSGSCKRQLAGEGQIDEAAPASASCRPFIDREGQFGQSLAGRQCTSDTLLSMHVRLNL